MTCPSNELDIAIIGAGITGLGVAYALKDSGLKVAVFDKGQLGRGTSDNHLRIIHGGFRYLQSLDFRRMWQSIQNQVRLTQTFPDLLQELPCLLPLKPISLRSRLPLTIANLGYSLCYSLISGQLKLIGKFQGQDPATRMAPILSDTLPAGAFEWRDYLLKDNDKLHILLQEQLCNSDIEVFENSELVTSTLEDQFWQLKFDGKADLVSAKLVVNCAGPAIEMVAGTLGQSLEHLQLEWVKAFNLVVNRTFTDQYGLAFDGNQGSLFFMTPRAPGHTAIGTFYLPAENEIALANLSDSEIDQAIQTLNNSLPALQLSRDQIVDVDIGFLPAKKSLNATPLILKKEEIVKGARSLHILSVKYTTFLTVGDDVARIAQNMLRQ